MEVCGSVSLYVKLRHELPFGKAIFLVGGCQSLGRLDWTDDGCWRKRLLVPRKATLQYKYVIGNFQDPEGHELEWEVGSNRVIQSRLMDTNQAYLDQKWNTLRIKLQLLTDPNNEIDQMFVLGNCVDLGMKIAKRSLIKEKPTWQGGHPRTLWTLVFITDKQRDQIIYYYFAKNDHSIQRTREPGRYFFTNPDSPNNLFDRQSVQYWPGQVRITEFQSFKGFRISKLTDHIFIGPYIKSKQDFVVLRQSGVKAVLNLQSLQDMSKHKVDWKSIKELAEEYGMSCCNFQIFDMNVSDFINKSSEALKLLHTMISLHGCVYIHCTAGIYRSPQLAILYLVRFENYQLQKALQLIKDKRPYANPYLDCLRQALDEVCASLGTIQGKKTDKSLIIDII